MTQTSYGDPMVLELEDQFFDWNKVIIEDPISNSYTPKGRSSFQETTSKVYFDDDGVKRELFIKLAPQNFFGPNPTQPLHLRKDQQNEDTIDGYQIGYPLTSFSTVDNPTEYEQATKYAFDSMFEVTCKAMERFCSVKRSECKVPAPTYSSFGAAKVDGDWTYAVKPLYVYQKSVDENTGEKIDDKTKPMKAYIKLKTRGKGKNIKCLTRIHGPGDKLTHPKELKDIRIEGYPVIQWEGVFWGTHGRNSHGASLRLKVNDMNFTPTKDDDRRLCKYRILSPNTAPLPQEEEEEEQKSEEEEVIIVKKEKEEKELIIID